MNDFERTLLESPSLPRVPAPARLLIELMRAGDLDEAAVLEVLGQDPDLARRVLAVENELRQPTGAALTSLDDTVAALGTHSLAGVGLALSLATGLRDALGTGELIDALWRACWTTALAARRLADECGSWNPGEAFLAGLLEKVGALLMYQQRPEYARVLSAYLDGEYALLDLERARFPSDHGRLGVLALESWGLSGSVPEALRAHFAIDRSGIAELALQRGRILTGAALSGRTLSVEGFAHETDMLEKRVSALTRVSPDAAHRLAVELPRHARATSDVLELPGDRQRDYSELLEDAHTFERGSESTPASRSPRFRSSSRGFEELLRDGIEALSADPETGRFDMVGFDRIMRAFIDRARQLHRPIALVVLSLDDFKNLVETAGPEIAHQVLGEIRERAAATVRSSDPKGHLSDSHFGILAAGCSSEDLPRLAERIRGQVSREPVQTPQGPVRCQVAIGLACAIPHSDGADAQNLLSSAWSALDEAVLNGQAIAMGA